MNTKIISIICYLIAILLAIIGQIMSMFVTEKEIAMILIFAPIILIAVGSLLPLIIAE